MDVFCPICGEPWDVGFFADYAEDELWGEDYAPEDVQALASTLRTKFRKVGCRAFGTPCGPYEASPKIQAAFELCGDDFDGAAVLMHDLL